MRKFRGKEFFRRIAVALLITGICAENVPVSAVSAADTDTQTSVSDETDTGTASSGTEEAGSTGSASEGAGTEDAAEEAKDADSSNAADSASSVSEDADNSASEASSIHTQVSTSASTEASKEMEIVSEDRDFDSSKIDVWDFSALSYDTDTYNNRLTDVTINGFKPEVTAGTTGVYFGSFSVDDGDFFFHSTGNYNYLRTTNTSLTRTDNSYLQNNGTYYNGYLYNNSAANDSNYIGIECLKGDTITLIAGALSGTSITYTFESADSADVQTKVMTRTSTVTADTMSFTAGTAGLYKIYSTDNKFAIAAVKREHAPELVYRTVSGALTIPDSLAEQSYALTFTNAADGSTYTAQTAESTYSVSLPQGYTYDIALSGAAGTYTLTTASVTVAKADMTKNLTILGSDEPIVYGDGKTDVWDFGAAELSTEGYNNRLTEDVINGFYAADAVAGSEGNLIGDFRLSGSGFAFVSGGGSHRIRTTNTAITRYDSKSLKDSDGNVYKGYLYSNAGSSSSVYFEVTCLADDTVTIVAGSNGNSSNIVFEDEADASNQQIQTFTPGSATAAVMTFTAPKAGTYKIYSQNEKLVAARLTRSHAVYYPVSGSVTAPDTIGSCSLQFTNETTGEIVTASVKDGAYSCRLAGGFSYDTALVDASGAAITDYVITGNSIVTVASSNVTADFTVEAIDMVTVTGTLTGVDAEDLTALVKNAVFTLSPETSETVTTAYVPELNISADGSYTLYLEKGIVYDLTLTGIDNYALAAGTITADADGEQNIVLVKKGSYAVTVIPDGCTAEDLTGAVFTFTKLDDTYKAETDFVYTFTGTDSIFLTDGTYHVDVTFPSGSTFRQKATQELTVAGSACDLTLAVDSTLYRSQVTVGADGCEYTTIADALDEVRAMQRDDLTQRVTILIQPGNYEEMLVIDEANVSLKNASDTPSVETTEAGVSIAANAVRITSYYGHGYTYYSMGSDCKYDADVLASNLKNGSASYTNPGAGTTNGSYWNATVVVNKAGFEADGIIFENSFNQYVSAKAAADKIVAQTGAKEGDTARSELSAGSTKVQEKAYVERAAALAMTAAATDTYFNNCRIIGRQDTLYGAVGSTDAFYKCDIYGGTDYIFGGMSAVFAQCDLVMNTSDDKNDTAYITAAQTQSGSRGYLMYKCNITSTTPGVDTASAHTSKPGYFGRPWSGATAEVVYYGTTIAATSDWHYDSTKKTYVLNDSDTSSEYAPVSLINPAGWLAWSGTTTSDRFVEALSTEVSGEDNASERVSWAAAASSLVCADGTAASVTAFLGNDPFTAHGVSIDPEVPVVPVIDPVALTCSVSDGTSEETTYTMPFLANADGTLTVTDSQGKEAASAQVTANTETDVTLALVSGANQFHIAFTPAAEYVTAEGAKLTSYDAWETDITVTCTIKTIAPSYQITSAQTAESASYALQFLSNAGGKVTITDAAGKVIANAKSVSAGSAKSFKTTLASGANVFHISFNPANKQIKVDGIYYSLTSYDTAAFDFTVTYTAPVYEEGLVTDAKGVTHYQYSDGTYAKKTFVTVNDKTYYFDKNGKMKTGWIKVNKKKYYATADAGLTTGWATIKNKKYYFNSDGSTACGLTAIGGKTYYFDNDGKMITGWKKIDGVYRFFGTDGALDPAKTKKK